MPSGSGTEIDPFQIGSLGNLRWLMLNSTEWAKYYIQTADIKIFSNCKTLISCLSQEEFSWR